MASIDFRKYTRVCVSALGVHFDADKRKTLCHENKHIDVTKSDMNYFYDCKSYDEMCHRAAARVEEVDKIKPPKRIRQDRVTVVSAEIPCPLCIEHQGKADDFFKFAYEQLQAYFGNANVCGMTVHKDEKHMYHDHGIEKESLYHGHAFLVPYTDEKGINGKAFLTRDKMRELHEWFNNKVLDKYGVEYQTHEVPGKKPVEVLKAKEELETVKKELKDSYNELEEVRNDIARAKNIKKKLFSEHNGYAQYSVAEVEQLKAERDYYKKAVDEVEMKQQFQQTGYSNYISGTIQKAKADGQNAINKRNFANIEEVKQKFPRIVERETKKQVNELLQQLQLPETDLKPFKRIVDKMIEEIVKRNAPQLDTHEFDIDFEHGER